MSTQEPKEETRKLCPLHLLAKSFAQNSTVNPVCIEERCAWWVESRSSRTRDGVDMVWAYEEGRCGMAR